MRPIPEQDQLFIDAAAELSRLYQDGRNNTPIPELRIGLRYALYTGSEHHLRRAISKARELAPEVQS